ncbi:MAG: ethanolamine ammonia-lyase reactivating factor EutA [Bacillaceae bacterium]|nr:ethanolamine ammonia-lyase reactivating factor EutA [Bacillaceae bacterium]
MHEDWITSAGIDVGTSTTKLIISRLKINRVSGSFALPRFDIVDRKIVYRSPIIHTPLKNREEIDVETLSGWLSDQYQNAGIQLQDIQSGAVIITGETAIKKNAETILHHLADHSGKFVVAMAGAHLEGILAGKGSGALERSRQVAGVVANVDIGGGTANTVFFKRGQVLGTVTFHAGGRLIELDDTGMIHHLSPSIQPWLRHHNIHLTNGSRIDFPLLEHITGQLSQDLTDVLTGQKSLDQLKPLLHSTTVDNIPDIQDIIISGGIGSLWQNIKQPANLRDVAIYKDMGPLLAYQLKQILRQSTFQIIPPLFSSRATVIGAGMQSTELSGSTIYVDPSILPVRNVPVLSIDLTGITGTDDLSQQQLKTLIHEKMLTGKKIFTENEQIPFALSIQGLEHCSYRFNKNLAHTLHRSYRTLFPDAEALITVCQFDMAKALGHSLKLLAKDDYKIACIDQIDVKHGDYLDMGEIIPPSMVPVVIKTLAFS